VEAEPEPFTTVAPGTDELKVRYNERISERSSAGTLEAAVQIVPEVAEYTVSHERDGLNIDIPGGLRPGLTYTVRILPAIQDMFGNPMAGPFEWAFSTGGEFTDNAVVGQIWDRATGQFLPETRVVLTAADPGTADTARYVVSSGEQGLYALRVLPPGEFQVEAYQDRDRNRIRDAGEPWGAANASLGPADTVFLDVPVLLPDTTPAILAVGELLDSTVVRLAFDDRLDPDSPLSGLTVTLMEDTASAAESPAVEDAPAPDPGPPALPGVERIFHEWEWVSFVDSLSTAQDSAFQARVEALRAAGDTAAADSVAREGMPPLPGGGSGAPADGAETLPDGRPVPQPSVVVLLNGPLPAGVPVLVQVAGAVNLNGLPGGGGARSIMRELPPPDTTALDTVPEDTMSAPATLPPDTGAVLLPGLVPTGPANRR
jgi:hypothetical protein